MNAVSRHSALILLLIVCCGVSVVGAYVIRDLQGADSEAREMYTGSVRGLQGIGELQYDAQETRRATFYALTTTDSNLQIEYADQSRSADHRVKDEILDYGLHVKQPEEKALASRLERNWSNYLAIRDDVLASILEGSIKEAVDMDLSKGVPAFEHVREDLNEVKRLYDQDAARRQADLAASSRRTYIRLVGILIFTFLLSGAAVWVIQRSRMSSAIQLAKLQMEFVASVSHELRTPLAVMTSAADNLADGLIAEKAAVKKYGAVLRHQSRAMGDLVDQILLFASTEDQRRQYILRPLEIKPLIDSIVANSKGLIQKEGFVLDLQIDSDLPPVMGDSVGISQCLQNLIGNAAKYGGSDRRVTLRVSTANVEHGAGQELRISVADRGIGIESSELSHIFDPFYRSPRVQAAQIHGTGLGLSLAKRIAESMGGKITVLSELHAGSTFTLHLQLAKGQESGKATPEFVPSATSSL